MTPLVLDISRLISRVGQGPHTGIDRVELAYFRHVLTCDRPVYFLCRLPKAFAILDADGGARILEKVTGRTAWGTAGMFRFIAPGMSLAQQRAVADIRRSAQIVTTRRLLAARISRHFPAGVTYLNVGHSNLRQEVFDAVKAHEENRIIVFVHDIIPLSSPEFSTPAVAERFKADMVRVARYADMVIYNSAVTQAAAEGFFATTGPVPEGIVAHLGQDLPGLLMQAASSHPSFVALGTIEPRKNHALLLRLWQNMVETCDPARIPVLHIIGRRGWNNANVFSILDNDPMMGKHVFEHKNLSDQDCRDLLAQSWALLFPSHIEGFGLPLIEAAACGVPVICGENAIYREILGNYPLYLNVDNSYAWQQGILERAGRKRESEVDRQVRGRSVKIPDWNGHFDRIFRFV